MASSTRAHKAKLRAGRDQPIDDHRHHQIATPARGRILGGAQDQPVQRDLADGAQRRRDVPVRQRAFNPQRSRVGADHDAALEQGLQAFDHRARQLAEIGQCALLRTALIVAETLAQQHGGGRGTVGHGLDEQVRTESQIAPPENPLHGHKTKSDHSQSFGQTH
ncbi:MAG TPA: hypothetical protein VE690_05500 [Rhodopila sp.]|nr:hypothetical protein [Rhodopila sp.]